MDLKPFRLDIDELINEFAEGEMTMLADMKRIWLSKKFSCIFEAKPTTKLGFFMQSLYTHCLEKIGIVHTLVNSMLERNLFLYGAIDLKEGSVEERVNELTDIQNARVQHANKKLFADTQIERYIHMDMGKELDLDSLKEMSRDYCMAKEIAFKEAENVIDTQDIKHIAENQTLIGDVVGKTTEDWNVQKETFYQKTRLNQRPSENSSFEQQNNNGNIDAIEFNVEDDAYAEKDDNFCDELEQQLLSLTES
ncbi:Small nuclear RNA activating complex (SNAPc), subunit SNAP43 [Cynara cardunculus var. scolymus]|uniref:Small nuclear RNA activating complex (SNAPc), subunit SNAP43 n=1 Tax=Cynara cardunculus var. scolymus TaxID=59895 RepID=A0A118K0G0_CYNCS|nr:Small nuclear RNA activating complex (SNAPc), subunit SNAP43 [Cynara cardunculus var. scolymus]